MRTWPAAALAVFAVFPGMLAAKEPITPESYSITVNAPPAVPPTLPARYEPNTLRDYPPISSTDEGQRELIASISCKGDPDGRRATLENCARVLADPAIPLEIKRKAQFSRLYILSDMEPPQAVKEGRQWIAEHPEEPEALMIRRCLVIGACRKQMPLDWLKTLFAEIFDNYPATDPNVISSHVLLADTLSKYASFHMSKALTVERDAHYILAQNTMRELIDKGTLSPREKEQLTNSIASIERRMHPELDKRTPEEQAEIDARLKAQQQAQIESALRAGYIREIRRPDGKVDYEPVRPTGKKPPARVTAEQLKKWYPLTAEEGEGEKPAN